MKLKLFTILTLLCLALLSKAQPLSKLSTTEGGSAYEVCYYNNYLYAGCANTLEVFGLTGPNHTPDSARVKIRLLSNIDYIVEHNGYLYVCANHDGLYKYDISNPLNPQQKAHYVPQNINESIYDVAFYGDTIYVAAKTKVTMLADSNNTITYKGTVATYTGTTNRVLGVDVKDSLLAYTVAYTASNTQTGVYLHNIKNNNQLLNFYHDASSNPFDVVFGQNTKLMHIMGGTFNTLFSDSGRYYALDYTNPGAMSLKFSQTIKGFLPFGAFSCPMNAVIINDTVYVSTQGGVLPGYNISIPLTGQVYVFKATTTSSVSYLTSIYGGLYHFDADIDPVTKTMYVASEWYGVLTVDITDIYNEISRGKTLTGGWCHGSANAKDRLVEASEGYGMRLFNTAVMQTPILIAEDTAVGFCRAISLSDSADYVYGWYLTGKRFRVKGGNTLNPIAEINVDSTVALPGDFQKSRHYANKVAAIEDPGLGTKKIVVADVTNPAAPFIQPIRLKSNVSDLLFHPGTGVLMALATDSIIVLNQNTMATLAGVGPPAGAFQQYKAFTLSGDTLYVYYDGLGEGIAKYLYNTGNNSLTYLSALPYNMISTDRIFMASENSLLYISSSLDSLRALTKTNHTVVAKYNHGADFIYDNLWGVHDLYYNKGYLFLNEYMGQTTIFGPPTPTSGIQEAGTKKQEAALVFPNPTSNYFTVKTGSRNESTVRIYDAVGKLIYIADVYGERITIDASQFTNGFYFVSVFADGKETKSKLVVQK